MPTWREYLRQTGHRLETESDFKRIFDERGLKVDDLDKHLDGFGWEDQWDNFLSPQAKAHHFLKQLDLGTDPESKLRRAGQMHFESFGSGPGNSYHWVDLKDDLTVSLLQAKPVCKSRLSLLRIGPKSSEAHGRGHGRGQDDCG